MKLFLISSNISSKKWKKWEKEKYFLQEKETIGYSLSVEKYIDFGSNKFSCFRFPDRVCRNSSTVAKFRLTFHDEKKRKKCDLRYIYIFQSEQGDKNRRKKSIGYDVIKTWLAPRVPFTTCVEYERCFILNWPA